MRVSINLEATICQCNWAFICQVVFLVISCRVMSERRLNAVKVAAELEGSCSDSFALSMNTGQEQYEWRI